MHNLLLVFLFGGFVCMLAQILIDKTSLTPARILVLYVCLGVFIYATGLYEPLFNYFGAGVSLPLLGFGAGIGRGVFEAVNSEGAIGILTGGLTATAAGITVAILCGVIFALLAKGKGKRM